LPFVAIGSHANQDIFPRSVVSGISADAQSSPNGSASTGQHFDSSFVTDAHSSPNASASTGHILSAILQLTPPFSPLVRHHSTP
jgi:hypothetical protein